MVAYDKAIASDQAPLWEQRSIVFLEDKITYSHLYPMFNQMTNRVVLDN